MYKKNKKKLLATFIIAFLILVFSFGLLHNSEKKSFLETMDLSPTESSYPLSPPWGTDDSDYSDQQYYLNTINIFNAWEIETGSSDITVAIVDSG
ncbi:MAG: hypothetical protein K9L64_04355, partial [Candidatus Izimaplasma sp.]|nr:hypothetical protein [Candidatus Izimaplasma bacterium]